MALQEMIDLESNIGSQAVSSNEGRQMRILRLLVLFGLGGLGAILVFLAWNSDVSYIYRRHWQAQRQLSLDFNELQVLSTAEVVRTFPVDLFCRSGKSELGDSFCATELSRWNSIEALDTVFFFESGQLAFAKVDMPPWAHDKLLAYVKQHHGEPAGYTNRVQWGKLLLAGAGNVAAASIGVPLKFDMSPDELGVWGLASGACLVVNMAADWPMQWSTAFWVSPHKPCLNQMIKGQITVPEVKSRSPF